MTVKMKITLVFLVRYLDKEGIIYAMSSASSPASDLKNNNRIVNNETMARISWRRGQLNKNTFNLLFKIQTDRKFHRTFVPLRHGLRLLIMKITSNEAKIMI